MKLSLFAGIGVPILLAYVYGVVPVSLCRSGGCGVTTTNSGGVRFEFDDENDVTVGVSGPYSGWYIHHNLHGSTISTECYMITMW